MGYNASIAVLSKLPVQAREFLEEAQPFPMGTKGRAIERMVNLVVRDLCPEFVINGLNGKCLIEKASCFESLDSFGKDDIRALATKFTVTTYYIYPAKIRAFYGIPEKCAYWNTYYPPVSNGEEKSTVEHLIFSVSEEDAINQVGWVVPYPANYEDEISGIEDCEYYAWWSDTITDWDREAPNQTAYRDRHLFHRVVSYVEKTGRKLNNGEWIVIAHGDQLQSIGLLRHFIRPESVLVFSGGF